MSTVLHKSTARPKAISQSRGAVKLFCLPHAGAGASSYARWPAAFGAGIDVQAIQLPGRENRIREAPIIDPNALATRFAESIDGPYAIFGHSMGGRLAFEIVHRLRVAGARLPEVLFVSGCRAPDVVSDGLLDGLSRVDDDELITRLCAGGGLPTEVLDEPELLELLLPTLRGDFTWLDDYVYIESEPLPIPIICFAGGQDRAAPVEEMRGWQRHTTVDFKLHVMPGGHFFLRDQLLELVTHIESALLADHAAAAPNHHVSLRRWSVWRDAILRTTGFPAEGLDRFTSPQCAAAADAWLAGSSDRNTFDACFDAVSADGSSQIRAIAADARFREAVAWQNPAMLHTLDSLISERYRPSVARHREATVARYWQRYCAKNETIGFFGPVCWARIEDAMHEMVDAHPGSGVIRERRVFLESWAVQAFADALASDPNVHRWLCPRPQPHVTIVGRHAHCPPKPTRALSSVECAALTACNGERTAVDVVASLGLPSAEDGYFLLERLVEAGLLRWDFDIPTDPTAEAVLVAKVEAIPEPSARAAATARLSRLQIARHAVANAAGDAEALRTALAALESEFTTATGLASHRRAGEHYAGRHLCYEDTSRDLDVRFGQDLLAPLAAPLDLVLRAARWLCVELAEEHAAALRELYDELADTQRNGEPVDFAELWFLSQGMFFGESERPADAAVHSLRERWEKLFESVGSLSDDDSQIQLHSRHLAEHFDRIFPERGPGWSAGRLHSPDLQLSAPSIEALNRGDFSIVLGELHVAWPTFDNALFVNFHPQPADLVRALASDLGPNRIRLLYPPDWPRGAGRLAPVLAGPTDCLLGFTAAPGALRNRLVPASSLVVRHDTATDQLIAVARDGNQWPLLEVFGPLMATRAVDGFEILGGRAHTPRITIDRLVVARETWRTTVAETGLADVTGDRERFLAARRWRARLALPERVFVRISTETKPVYVDFRAPLYVRMLCSLLRTAAEAGDDVRIVVTEMLPTTEETWVVDREGNHYFSELRLQVSDHG